MLSPVTWELSGPCDTLPMRDDIIVIPRWLLSIFPTVLKSQNMTATYQYPHIQTLWDEVYIGLAKKFVWVFPYYLAGKPKQTFRPNQ